MIQSSLEALATTLSSLGGIKRIYKKLSIHHLLIQSLLPMYAHFSVAQSLAVQFIIKKIASKLHIVNAITPTLQPRITVINTHISLSNLLAIPVFGLAVEVAA